MARIPLDRTVQRAEVLWRRSGDVVLVRRPGKRVSDGGVSPFDETVGDETLGDETVVLADTGVGLWLRLDEPVRVDDLCADLASAYGVEVDLVRDDVRAALDDLIGRGLAVDVD